MQVRERGGMRIDGILELIETATRRDPLDEVLQRMCEHVAVIAHAEVVSVYVREEREDGIWLVMRANVGFPRDTLGQVMLRPGEGITGWAAERMRPMSAAIAKDDTHYKFVPELGEEQYPSFLSVPLVTGGVSVGVLNFQRSETAEFSSTEVALCTVLAAPFALAVDRERNAGTETPPDAGRSARLSGAGLSSGRALGRAAVPPTFDTLEEPVGPGPEACAIAIEAIAEVEGKVNAAIEQLGDRLNERDRADLAVLTVMLSDQRLRQLVEEHTTELGVVGGLRKVSRDYVAVPYRVGGEVDPWMRDRADAIEELCRWLAIEASQTQPPHPGSILLHADRVGPFAVLAARGRKLVGMAVGAPVDRDSLGARLCRACDMPLVSDVTGLFAWARGGDTLLIDGDTGVLRVNPSGAVLAQFRHQG